MEIYVVKENAMSKEEEEFLNNLDPESDLAYEIFDVEGNFKGIKY